MTKDQPMQASSSSVHSDLLPKLGLLLGDCTGIGPELVAKVLNDPRTRDVARIAVIGDVRVLELGMRDAKVQLK